MPWRILNGNVRAIFQRQTSCSPRRFNGATAPFHSLYGATVLLYLPKSMDLCVVNGLVVGAVCGGHAAVGYSLKLMLLEPFLWCDPTLSSFIDLTHSPNRVWLIFFLFGVANFFFFSRCVLSPSLLSGVAANFFFLCVFPPSLLSGARNLLSMVRLHFFLPLNGAAAPFSPFQSCYLTPRMMWRSILHLSTDRKTPHFKSPFSFSSSSPYSCCIFFLFLFPENSLSLKKKLSSPLVSSPQNYLYSFP